MSREWTFHLTDMLTCCDRISRYASGLTRKSFETNEMAYDAIIRNIQLLGEAARHIPDETKRTAPDIEWRSVIAVRNILVHGYFSIDNDIVWDIIQNKIPPMCKSLAVLKSKIM